MERMLCLKKILMLFATALLVISGLALCSCNRDRVSAERTAPPTESTNGGSVEPSTVPGLPESTSGSGSSNTLSQNLGRAEGEIQEAGPDGSRDVKSPKVWLVFSKSASGEASDTEVELSEDADSVLSLYWKFLLSVKKDTDLITMVEVRNDARKSLLKTEIDAPEGRRGITWDESGSILDYLADAFIRRRVDASPKPAA